VPAPYAALHEGLVVANKYRLIEVRGEGAMGAVWSATHLTLGHTVAIKFLNVSTAGSPGGRARFEREARIAARLGEASRHISRVIDHGVLDDGMPYIVMELLLGESLATYLKREKVVSLQRSARIVQHLARALHVAHSAGVVHRDLKPANIFLCQPEPGEDLYVKLLDFGIAKATEADDEGTGNALLGTPSYMSPEQLSDGTIDARTDLWAIAAIVYRMTVGRPPFGGGPIGEVGFRIVSTDPVPPSQANPDVPPELDMWMTRALAKRVEDRFQTAGELSDFLGVVAGLSPGLVSSGEMRAAVLPAGEEQEGSSRERKAESSAGLGGAYASVAPPRRTSRLAPVAIVLGVAVLVLTAALLRRSGGQQAAAGPVETKKTEVSATPPAPSPSVTASTSASVLPPPASASVSPSAKSSAVPSKGKKQSQDTSGWGNKKEL